MRTSSRPLEVVEDGVCGEPALRHRNVRAAQRRAIADHEHARNSGRGVMAAYDFHYSRHGHAMLATEQARKLVRRLQPIADTDGVHCKLFAICLRNRSERRDGRLLHTAVAGSAQNVMTEMDRHPVFAEQSPIIDATRGQPRRVERHCEGCGNVAWPRMGGRLCDSHHLRASFEKLACELQVQGAVSGDQHALARRHSVTAHQSLCRARCHDTGQRPAFEGRHGFVSAGREHDLPRAHLAGLVGT